MWPSVCLRKFSFRETWASREIYITVITHLSATNSAQLHFKTGSALWYNWAIIQVSFAWLSLETEHIIDTRDDPCGLLWAICFLSTAPTMTSQIDFISQTSSAAGFNSTLATGPWGTRSLKTIWNFLLYWLFLAVREKGICVTTERIPHVPNTSTCVYSSENIYFIPFSEVVGMYPYLSCSLSSSVIVTSLLLFCCNVYTSLKVLFSSIYSILSLSLSLSKHSLSHIIMTECGSMQPGAWSFLWHQHTCRVEFGDQNNWGS